MPNKDSEFLSLLNEEIAQDSDDLKQFVRETADIKPLFQDKVAVTTKVLDKSTAKIRQASATRLPEVESDGASSAFVNMVGPNEILEYRKAGVQPYVVSRLRAGEYHEADYIDLHGKTIEKAYDMVMDFISFAKEKEFRCILIVHGKGELRK